MFSDANVQLPYCGAPPAPDVVWSRWNLDPFLIAALILLLGGYLVAFKRHSARVGLTPYHRIAFAAGWVLTVAALISPLCPLSVSLFSARIAQHMLLTLIAAPLVVLGRVDRLLLAPGPPHVPQVAARWLGWATGGAGSMLLFILALWFWHAPGPYAATFANALIYWLMHITVFGAALLVWNVLLDPTPEKAAVAIFVGLATTLQMTFLGAIITLTPQLLYSPHALTTLAWGMTPQVDQQLGGIIMWVPGCSIFLLATLATLRRVMRDALPAGPSSQGISDAKV